VVYFSKKNLFLIFFNPEKPLQTRALCLIGLIVSSAFMILGGIWPSLFTLLAIPFIPTPLVYFAGVFWPNFIYQRPQLKFYLVLSALISFFCVGCEFAFLGIFATIDWKKLW
jgi:hypothetical protein